MSVPNNVIENVKRYFEANLPEYEVVKVLRRSSHPLDDYLYMVIGKKNQDKYNMGKYSCWTCWNETTQTLNYGHYCIPTEEDVLKVVMEYYN